MIQPAFKYDYEGSGDVPSRKIEHKADVLRFMKGTPHGDAVAGGFFLDEKTGEAVRIPWRSYRAGDFWWTTADLYHFEKYDLELKPDFIKYALSHS